MNARKLLNVRVGLTATALALCGALVTSAMTTSCASSSSSNGGTTGSTGGSGTGGSTGNGGSTGSGGSTSDGTGGSSGSSSCPSVPNGVSYCDGMAQGDLMKGYAYIALGVDDTATSPVCADHADDLTNTRQITAPTPGQCMEDGKTCPLDGHTVWADSNKLCIKGSIPVVSGGDYTKNWGLQIGANTSQPPADQDGGKTLGENSDKAASYTTITATTSGSITPADTKYKAAVRVVIHLKSMACTDDPYCATMESGTPIKLTSFTTACWGSCTGSCKKLTTDDIPNIDKIGIQICADTYTSYTADPYCLESIVFGTD